MEIALTVLAVFAGGGIAFLIVWAAQKSPIPYQDRVDETTRRRIEKENECPKG